MLRYSIDYMQAAEQSVAATGFMLCAAQFYIFKCKHGVVVFSGGHVVGRVLQVVQL